MEEKIKVLFERYQSGEASKKEIEIVENWFSAFDMQHKLPHREQNPAIFANLDKQIQQLVPCKPVYNRFITRWLSVAAAIVFVGISYLLFKKVTPASPKTITYTTITAPNGTKKQFELPDGSFVSLNSGSTITIPSSYGVPDREVALSGEGYFSVKHDVKHPFSVRAGKIIVSDIGTSFDVKAYREDPQTRIAVETGIVEIKSSRTGHKQKILANSLTANQQLSYNNKNGSQCIGFINAGEAVAWKQDRLVFINDSFEEIANTLHRWYNIPVVLQNTSARYRRYTVSFNNEPLHKVLGVLAHLSGLNYKIDNQTLFIDLKHCKKMK